MFIKDLVKNKRQELGETQEQFGKRFGLSHAAISDLESGKTKRIGEDMLIFVYKRDFKDFILPERIPFAGNKESELLCAGFNEYRRILLESDKES